jgi:hypothetical protein
MPHERRKLNTTAVSVYLVERGIGTASQEAVKLDQETQIGILGLGGGTASLLGVLVFDVDTHGDCDESNVQVRGYGTNRQEKASVLFPEQSTWSLGRASIRSRM